ncbi:MAG: HAMP domain-containing sensor histidine kinase [Actinomycetaceae bacterium]|nr:HAMP domain-containing sensor histidine kinase [Actinomycetaceae bacterium]
MTTPAPRVTSRLSLATRISIFIAVLVSLALVALGAATGVVLRSWLSGEIDNNVRETLHHFEKKYASGSEPASILLRQPPQSSGDPNGGDTLFGFPIDGQNNAQESGMETEIFEGTEPEKDWDDKGDPPSLKGPGAAEGQLLLYANDSAVAAGVVEQFESVQLQPEEIAPILELPPDDQPRTIVIGERGEFRVIADTAPDGSFIASGHSLSQLNGTIATLLFVELIFGAIIITVAAAVGRRWVVQEMRPLGAVASTARHIGRRDLTSENLAPFGRIDSEAAQPGTEVGDVGHALNAMIDNVEGALTARAESENKLRRFVADASHELRTPLASIQGYTQLLQRDSIDAPTALARISSESARMSGLVEDLLLLARLDAGRELDLEPVDVIPLVIDAVMDAHAAGPDHKWILDVPDGIDAEKCVVLGDEPALRQVLANLVNNARVHTPSGTEVKIGVRLEGEPKDSANQGVQDGADADIEKESAPKGGALRKVAAASKAQAAKMAAASTKSAADTVATPPSSMSDDASRHTIALYVSDNGPGIPADLRPTVFDRFVRGDVSRTRCDGKGSSGLGLAIVSSIAKALNGRVEMDTHSAEDGEGETGTTFTVRLPQVSSDS